MIIRPDQLTETSTSITEPVTTAYAKTHMRVDITADDTLIGNLVSAAREYAEQFCNRSFAVHTFRADLPGFYDEMVLPLQPIQSITHIKYYDNASPSVLQTLGTGVYSFDRDRITRRSGQSWPTVDARPRPVQITFVTGWRDQSSPQGVGADCPEAVKSCILLMAASLYENREYESAYAGQLLESRAFKMLLAPYRLYQ